MSASLKRIKELLTTSFAMDVAQQAELQAFSRQERMNSVLERFSSPVQRFYCGATVFVTGGSGFMGKHLLEKLFRSCKIKKAYVLLRSKKGKAIAERLEHMLKDPVFDGLRQKQPDFTSRIVPVEGDAGDLRLGISNEDWNTLTEQVIVIFHMAATIRFDEPLRVATLVNVRGTREALALARQCTHLKKFVHVSTAYSHATYPRVGREVLEQFYAAPVPPDVIIGLAETVDETRLNSITAELIKDWPNTYTFTKAIAEEAVSSMAADLPACVVRPAIVICSYTEPAPGWLDLSCVFGPSGIVFGVGLGVLHTFFVDVHKRQSLVPVDYVNNAIIAAAWDSTAHKRGTHIPVYTVANVGTGIQWSFVAMILRSEEIRRLGSTFAVWYCFLLETTNRLYFHLLTWLLHYIPAYTVDGICAVFRIQTPKEVPSFVKVYEKINKFTNVYNYFLTNEFTFQDDNVQSMIKRMSPEDKAIYNCDLSTVDPKEFVLMWCIGIRKYIVKDGLKDSERAYRKQCYFKIAHYTVMTMYFLIFLFILRVLWNVFRIF